MQRQPFVMVISGPSGAGKSTFVRMLLERHEELSFSVSATTRDMRKGEQNGREYHFLSRDEFKRRIEANDFLEHAEVHGQLYGTLLSDVGRAMDAGKSVLLDVDVQGGVQIKQRKPDAVLVFLLPPSMDVLAERLRSRATDSEDTIERRLKNAPNEIQAMTKYDFVVVNEDIATTQDDLEAIYRSECLRRERIVDASGGSDIVDEYLREKARPFRS